VRLDGVVLGVALRQRAGAEDAAGSRPIYKNNINHYLKNWQAGPG
jgi:hypothetical protein